MTRPVSPFAALLCALAACAQGESPNSGGSGDGDGDLLDASAISDAAIGVQPDAMELQPDAMPDAAPVGVDAAPVCPTDPCDLVDQCGCLAGEACDLAADPFAGNDCRTVASPGVEGSTCAGPGDCGAGYTCVADGFGSATCKPYCSGDEHCGAPRGQCLVQLQSGGADIPGALVCTSSCDPTDIAAGGCPLTYGCFPFIINPDGVAGSGDEVDIVECAPAGDGTQFDLCIDNSDCAPDYLCVDTGLTFFECLRQCDNVGAACAAVNGTDCLGFADPHVVGGTEYGACF